MAEAHIIGKIDDGIDNIVFRMDSGYTYRGYGKQVINFICSRGVL